MRAPRLGPPLAGWWGIARREQLRHHRGAHLGKRGTPRVLLFDVRGSESLGCRRFAIQSVRSLKAVAGVTPPRLAWFGVVVQDSNLRG